MFIARIFCGSSLKIIERELVAAKNMLEFTGTISMVTCFIEKNRSSKFEQDS